jgi:hypothetical protein
VLSIVELQCKIKKVQILFYSKLLFFFACLKLQKQAVMSIDHQELKACEAATEAILLWGKQSDKYL